MELSCFKSKFVLHRLGQAQGSGRLLAAILVILNG